MEWVLNLFLLTNQKTNSFIDQSARINHLHCPRTFLPGGHFRLGQPGGAFLFKLCSNAKLNLWLTGKHASYYATMAPNTSLRYIIWPNKMKEISIFTIHKNYVLVNIFQYILIFNIQFLSFFMYFTLTLTAELSYCAASI